MARTSTTLELLVSAYVFGGCFPGPIDAKVDAFDSATEDSSVLTDTAVTSEAVDTATIPMDSASPSDTAVPSDSGDTTDTSDEPDATASCEQDEACGHLTVAPCVLGRCIDHACAATNLTVACDDGDPCTTNDRCGQGTCAGRAFTVAERASWALRIGGAGEDSVIGVATHPSGEITIAGSFDTSFEFGGHTLTPTGKLDIWLARLSSAGDVVWVKSFGTANTYTAPIALVGRGERSTMFYVESTADAPSSGADYRWLTTSLREFEPNTIDGTELPGFFQGGDRFATDEVVALVRIQSATNIPLGAGGTINLDPDTGANGAVLVLDAGGVQRVVVLKNVAWPTNDIRLQDIDVVGDVARIILPFAANGAAEGVEVSGPSVVDVPLTGAVTVTALSASRGFQSYDRLEDRAAYAAIDALVPLDEVDGADDLVLAHGATGCAGASVPVGGFDDFVVVGATPVVPSGYVMWTRAIGAWNFGSGLTLDSGSPVTAILQLDDACQPHGLLTTNVETFDEGPVTVRRYLPVRSAADFVTLRGDLAGGLVIARTLDQSFTPAEPFPATFFSVQGEADAFVGRISPAVMFGCE